MNGQIRGWLRAAGVLVGVLALSVAAAAQDITGFEDGYLTFTNENPVLYYRVEFRPNLTGPEEWDKTYEGLINIKTNASSVTVPVGVFYRVVGSTNPLPTAPVAKTGQTTSYATGDDGDLAKGVAWPSPRFTDHGDGTVTDNQTGLMWTKNANLPGGTRNWDAAIEHCNVMNSGAGTYGYADWRLPNVRELQSLIDYARWNPSLPLGHPFTGVVSDNYWSSSTLADAIAHAWHVYLYRGDVLICGKTETHYVWPVRGGQ